MSKKEKIVIGNKYYLIKALNWIALNIVLPTLPMIVKLIVNIFSVSKVVVFDQNELLYYNFFICILLWELLRKEVTLFGFIIKCVIVFICMCDILFIAFVSTGQQSNISIWIFAISTAIICAGFGSAYIINKEKKSVKGETENG